MLWYSIASILFTTWYFWFLVCHLPFRAATASRYSIEIDFILILCGGKRTRPDLEDTDEIQTIIRIYNISEYE